MTAMVCDSFLVWFCGDNEKPRRNGRGVLVGDLNLQPDYVCAGCGGVSGSSRTNALPLLAGSASRSSPSRTSEDASRVIGMRWAFAAWYSAEMSGRSRRGL